VFNTEGEENGGVAGKKGYIYSSCSNFFIQLVLSANEHTMVQHSSCTTTMHLMNDRPQDKVLYVRRGNFMTAGVAFPSHTSFFAQTMFNYNETELFSGCPNCATIPHGYQHT